MQLFSQRGLDLQVDSGDSLDIRHFRIREEMSSLFEISLLARSANHSIDFNAVVGRPFQLTVSRASVSRRWTGIAASLRQVRSVEHGDGLSSYELVLVPSLWLLGQRRNYRIFQQVSEVEIVKTLLEEWEIVHEFKLTEHYKARKYRVQYAESDFAFMSRMLEDAGIAYHFEADVKGSKMVLTDAVHQSDPRMPPLTYRDGVKDLHESHATNLHIGQAVRPGKYTMMDHDYRLPSSIDLSSSHEAMNVPVEQRLERYHYAPGAFLFHNPKGDDTPSADDKGKTRTDTKEAQAIAKRRLEAQRGPALVASFESTALDSGPGSVVTFVGHPHAALAPGSRWLIVGNVIEGTSDGDWTHRSEVHAATLPFRPALSTPKPRISGVESATVVGPAGEEIHTDEFGRVRVHFHWDRYNTRDESASCWIHVVQPWGGTAYGGLNLPRIGHEVLVDFLGGDPDRPVITGRVYTNQQKVPYKLPHHKTRSTWKSDTSPGSGGFNELMFEDLAGRELVWHQAQKNRRKLVKHDEVSTIGNDRMKLVKANQIETTVANHVEVTEQNRTEITDQNRHVTIGQTLTKLIKADEIRQTQGNRQNFVQQMEDLVVGATKKEHVGGESHSIIDSLKSEAIGAVRSLIVGKDDQIKVGGNHALDAGNEIHLKAGDQIVIEAGTRITIKGPGGFIDFHAGGIDIVGNLVRINSGGSAANGKGANPQAPSQALQAQPPDPAKPIMDDVSKTGIAQD